MNMDLDQQDIMSSQERDTYDMRYFGLKTLTQLYLWRAWGAEMSLMPSVAQAYVRDYVDRFMPSQEVVLVAIAEYIVGIDDVPGEVK